MPQAASLGDAPEEEQAGAVGGGAGAAHRQKLGREGKGEGDRGLRAAGPVSGVAAEGGSKAVWSAFWATRPESWERAAVSALDCASAWSAPSTAALSALKSVRSTLSEASHWLNP